MVYIDAETKVEPRNVSYTLTFNVEYGVFASDRIDGSSKCLITVRELVKKGHDPKIKLHFEYNDPYSEFVEKKEEDITRERLEEIVLGKSTIPTRTFYRTGNDMETGELP